MTPEWESNRDRDENDEETPEYAESVMDLGETGDWLVCYRHEADAPWRMIAYQNQEPVFDDALFTDLGHSQRYVMGQYRLIQAKRYAEVRDALRRAYQKMAFEKRSAA